MLQRTGQAWPQTSLTHGETGTEERGEPVVGILMLALRTGSQISAWTYLGKAVPILSSVYNESLVIACLFQKRAAIKFHSHKKDISRTRYHQLQGSVFTGTTKDLL